LPHAVTGGEDEVAPVGIGSAWATFAVACAALLLPALPVAAAFGLLDAGPDGAARLAAAAAVVLGGGKLAAIALGLARSAVAPAID
jgi:hypothetical protein